MEERRRALASMAMLGSGDAVQATVAAKELGFLRRQRLHDSRLGAGRRAAEKA